MSIDKHHYHIFTGGSPNVPLAAGDRYYSQDLLRDFRFLHDKIGMSLHDMTTNDINTPIYLSGGAVTQGTGDTLNITAGLGYAKFNTTIPDDFGAAQPPGVISASLDAIRVAWTAQTNLAISGATLDGVTTNYVKVSYLETPLNNRNYAKKAGNYDYEITPSFSISVNSSVAGKTAITIATFTGTAGGSFTITNINPGLNFISNIGVGETLNQTANAKIQIYSHGTTAVDGLRITSGGTGKTATDGLLLGIDGSSNSFIKNYENSDFIFSTNNTERLRITSDGKLATGLETAPDVDTGGLCLKSSATSNIAFSIKNSNVSHSYSGTESDTVFEAKTDQNGGIILSAAGETLQSSPFTLFSDAVTPDTTTTNGSGGVFRFRATKSSGALGAGENILTISDLSNTRYIFKEDGTAYADVAWSTFSDKRLKADIVDSPYGLDSLLQIEPKMYKKYSGKIGKGDKKAKLEPLSERQEIGFVAQDLFKIIPEAVKKPKDENESFWGITESKLIPVLVKAIQELNDKITILEAGV